MGCKVSKATCKLKKNDVTYIYLEPKWPLFLKVIPPKQGLFQSKQGSFGFQVYIYILYNRFDPLPSMKMPFSEGPIRHLNYDLQSWFCADYLTTLPWTLEAPRPRRVKKLNIPSAKCGSNGNQIPYTLHLHHYYLKLSNMPRPNHRIVWQNLQRKSIRFNKGSEACGSQIRVAFNSLASTLFGW